MIKGEMTRSERIFVVSCVLVIGGLYLALLLLSFKYLEYPWYLPVILLGGLVLAFGGVRIALCIYKPKKDKE